MQSIYLMPCEAGRLMKPPVSGPRIRQLMDSGQLEGIRTPSGRRLILARSLERLIKQREAARKESLAQKGGDDDVAAEPNAR
jgi:hypothetical protein